MRKTDFIDAVYAAGWRPVLDAQYKGLEGLWEKLFPVIATLEIELDQSNETIEELLSITGKLTGKEGLEITNP